jgi:hypothetical protein
MAPSSTATPTTTAPTDPCPDARFTDNCEYQRVGRSSWTASRTPAGSFGSTLALPAAGGFHIYGVQGGRRAVTAPGLPSTALGPRCGASRVRLPEIIRSVIEWSHGFLRVGSWRWETGSVDDSADENEQAAADSRWNTEARWPSGPGSDGSEALLYGAINWCVKRWRAFRGDR